MSSDGPSSSDPRDDGDRNPMEEMLRQLGINLGPDGQVDLEALIKQIQSRLGAMGIFPGAPGSTGIPWEQTRQAARRVASLQGDDPTPSRASQHGLADALRLVDSWLDEASDFPALQSQPVVWSRADWVEKTFSAWQRITEPIVTSIASAMGRMLTEQTGDAPQELAGLTQMLTPMLDRMASQMYSMQLAEAIGKLSGEVVSGSEIGVQLLSTSQVALLPTNIAAFADGLDVSSDDVLLYITLREAARQRLFESVAWLGPQLLAMLEHYAREIRIDGRALEESIDIESMQDFTPEKLAEVSQQLQGKLFEPARTAEQLEILGRLETLLALIEGWVDHVTAQAAGRWMPDEPQLAETLRRRRASGGPAESVFSSLVGLELRPRRVRDATNLWAALRGERGTGGRDAVWHHPDLMPTAADLDDPLGYVNPDPALRPGDDLDAELQKLLTEESEGD